MEEKRIPEVKTRAGFQGKSGWMKKAHGRFLSSYKDRYMCVDKTEMLLYENEEKKNCVERVDLENYDKCHEIKGGFKKKHRLVLIRSPKSANKVHDLKFQAQTAEEKDAWIKALSDAINRAKNKVFDEVKVDESSNLEHVTRSRPKANRSRRPPTRIHMREVADVSSDGILRLDLDLENAIMPYSPSSSSVVDGTLTSDFTPDKTLSVINEADDKDQGQNKVLKPPMPPSKQPAVIQDETEEDVPENKNLTPPVPPSKDVKPSEAPDKAQETSPDSKKKTVVMPPNKPLSAIIPFEHPTPKTTVHPPTPPSKEKKPNATVEISHDDDIEDKDMTETDSGKDIGSNMEVTPLIRPNSPKTITEKEIFPKSEVLTPIVDMKETKNKILEAELSLTDSESVSLSPLLDSIDEDKERKAEEKSVDSGQHSDEDILEDSMSEEASPTRNSNNHLDTLDIQSSKTESSASLKLKISSTKGYTSWNLESPTPLKPTTKARSASSGDLLNEVNCFTVEKGHSSSVRIAVDVERLETEVVKKMEDTSQLLNKATRGDENPENLLAEAMEKLRRADLVLREVKKLQLAKDTCRRKSW